MLLRQSSNIWPQLRVLVIALVVVVCLIAFTLWSGVPSQKESGAFWVGVVVMLAVLFGFGWATWHLLIRPLPAGVSVPEARTLSATVRRALGVLLGISTLSITIGLFWDEVWHRKYGVPFGDDFFWRPHILMYFGFVSVTLLAFAGLYLVVWKGRGTFQQRFRANPAVGFMILVGAFLMYVLPADPIWHNIYGEDITAWSIPHLVLISSFVTIGLVSIAVYMTTLSARAWRPPLRLQLDDALPLLSAAVSLMVAYQFLITEWDAEDVGRWTGLNRPEWLLPVLIGGGALVFGLIALHTLRLPGAATLTGLLALGIRAGLVALFGMPEMKLHAWVLALFPMLAVDLYTAWTVRAGRSPSAWYTGTAGALGMAVALLTLYPRLYTLYPIQNVPVALVAIWLGCLGTAWLGASIGNFFATRNKQVEANTRPMWAASLAATVACAVFAVWFVLTAAPPV